MVEKSESGSGIREEQAGSYFLELRNIFELKYLNSLMRIRDGKNSDSGSGMEKSRIRDLVSGINIPDPQHLLLSTAFNWSSHFYVSPCLSPFLVLATSPHSWQTKVGRWPDRCCASICRNMSVFILKGETEENKTNPISFIAELSTLYSL
jgi:hypothetical protein